MSVNSCLRPLCSLDGWAVTTTEGLGSQVRPILLDLNVVSGEFPLPTVQICLIFGSRRKAPQATGFHPIQRRIADFNGSQCGFCTPGMVLTAYAALAGADEEGLTMQQMEALFDGNICRCTGYRPIMSACRSLATDRSVLS